MAQGRARIHPGDFSSAVQDAFAATYDGRDITVDEPEGPRILLEVVTERWLLPG